jgi:hypothetical protein
VEAADLALQITALSKDELRQSFEHHGVQVLYLDHEAFGIYGGQVVRYRYGRALVTGNAAHFSWIPGLRWENWRDP